MNVKDIPIIINTFNRLTCLRDLINFLETSETTNIIILDNNSTYPPLLEYFETLSYEKIRLNQNLGHEALWKSGHIKRFKRSHYVLTDPDVVPIEECPANFMQHFYNLMQKFPQYKKVGFSLKIDDIPDNFLHKSSVIAWEGQYWKEKVGPYGWKAPIDTTFALFHPSQPGPWEWAIRTGYPYIARHTTWYQDSNNLSDEDKYYNQSVQGVTHWSGK